MQIRKVLTGNVERIPPDTTIRDAAARMRDCDVGALPVYEGDRLVGMVTDRDIATRGIAEGCDPKTAKVKDIMSEGIVYCFEDQSVDEAAKLMREKQVRRLIVLNRDKRLVGIVSLGDLATSANEKLSGSALKGVSEPGH
jgi:CBS domain-containing protein